MPYGIFLKGNAMCLLKRFEGLERWLSGSKCAALAQVSGSILSTHMLHVHTCWQNTQRHEIKRKNF